MGKLNLKQLRLVKGVTIEKMADLLGVHRNTYSSWEEKPSSISIENCYKICEILNVEYDKDIFLP